MDGDSRSDLVTSGNDRFCVREEVGQHGLCLGLAAHGIFHQTSIPWTTITRIFEWTVNMLIQAYDGNLLAK